MWVSWLVSANPESNTAYAFPDVHFLHCVSCLSDSEISGYGIQPIVRVAARSITANVNDYIFVPILNAIAEPFDNSVQDNPSALLGLVTGDLLGGDNPLSRNQATINGNPITPNLTQFRFMSDVFPLTVPPVQEGTPLLRICLEPPIITEGTRNCIVGGWFVMLQILQAGIYYIRTFARGKGQYKSSSFYQIDVVDRFPQLFPRAPREIDAQDWSRPIIRGILRGKRENGEIDQEGLETMEQYLT
jgi:hypothetical protein